VNAIQKIALRAPCLLAAETLHPRFRHLSNHNGKWLATILTVNFGYE